MQLENKLEKIHNETLKPQRKKIQLLAQINAQKTTLVKENDIVKILYGHLGHKNRYPRKGEMSKDNGTNVIKALEIISVGNPNSHKQINLGLIDPSTYRKLCYTLRSLYRHVSSAMT